MLMQARPDARKGPKAIESLEPVASEHRPK